MLTLFSIPKPFHGNTAVIQRNAIRSWTLLGPRVEVLLLGDDDGVAAAAAEFGVRHIPGVPRNEHGTPLLDAAFAAAAGAATTPLVGYVNADIILLGDLVRAVSRLSVPRFLAVGRRWDLDVPGPWDFDRPDWEGRLRESVAVRGTAHPPMGSDYFIFPRGSDWKMPPFAVGRPQWDNWLIYRARELGMPVIDASASVTAIHQNHGYEHVKNATGQAWQGPEADRNRSLVGGKGGWDRIFVLDDATHLLLPGGLERALTDRHLLWRLERRIERRPDDRLRNALLARVYRYRALLPERLWRRVLHAFA